jgi:hypothetical protein
VQDSHILRLGLEGCFLQLEQVSDIKSYLSIKEWKRSGISYRFASQILDRDSVQGAMATFADGKQIADIAIQPMSIGAMMALKIFRIATQTTSMIVPGESPFPALRPIFREQIFTVDGSEFL